MLDWARFDPAMLGERTVHNLRMRACSDSTDGLWSMLRSNARRSVVVGEGDVLPLIITREDTVTVIGDGEDGRDGG